MQDPNSQINKIGKEPGETPEQVKERKSDLKIEKPEGIQEFIDAGIETGVDSGRIAEKKEEFRESFFSSFVKSIFSGGQPATTKKKPFPTRKIMKKQVQKQLKKEAKIVKNKISKVMRQKHFKPYELNVLIKRLRLIKDLLEGLASATVESVRKLWIKYVKNRELS